MEINSNRYAVNWAVIVQMGSTLMLMFRQFVSFQCHLHVLLCDLEVQNIEAIMQKIYFQASSDFHSVFRHSSLIMDNIIKIFMYALGYALAFLMQLILMANSEGRSLRRRFLEAVEISQQVSLISKSVLLTDFPTVYWVNQGFGLTLHSCSFVELKVQKSRAWNIPMKFNVTSFLNYI